MKSPIHCYIFFVVVCSLFSMPLSAKKPKYLVPIDEFNFTKRQPTYYGVALFSVDVAGIAPSIEIIRTGVDLDELDEAQFRGDLGQLRHHQARKIDLKNIEPGFYVLPLKEGTYQINKVNAPFFDMPFMLDLIEDPRWRFKVYEKSVTYVGHLTIEQERTSRHINTTFLSRAATLWPEINSSLQALNVTIPLKYGHGLFDQFEVFLNQSESELVDE